MCSQPYWLCQHTTCRFGVLHSYLGMLGMLDPCITAHRPSAALTGHMAFTFGPVGGADDEEHTV